MEERAIARREPPRWRRRQGAVEPTRVVAGANDHRLRARHIAPARRPRVDLAGNFIGRARIDVHFLARVEVACAAELDHMGPSAESAAPKLPAGVDGQIGAPKWLGGQGKRGSRGNDQEKHGRTMGRRHEDGLRCRPMQPMSPVMHDP